MSRLAVHILIDYRVFLILSVLRHLEIIVLAKMAVGWKNG